MASESAETPDRKPTINKKSFTEPQRLLKKGAVVNFVFMPESAKTEKESLLRECGSLPKFFTPNRTGSKDSLPGVRRNFGKEGSFGMTRPKLQEEYSESTDGPEKMTHQGFTDSVQAGEYRNVLNNSKPVSIQTQVTHGRQPPNKKTDDSRDTPTHKVSWSASTERTEELDETTPPDKTAASKLMQARVLCFEVLLGALICMCLHIDGFPFLVLSGCSRGVPGTSRGLIAFLSQCYAFDACKLAVCWRKQGCLLFTVVAPTLQFSDNICQARRYLIYLSNERLPFMASQLDLV